MKARVTTPGDGVFQYSAGSALLVGRSLSKTGPNAALPLTERIQSRLGTAPALTAPSRTLPSAPFILIGLAQDHPLLRKLIADHRASLPKEGLGEEGYVLEVSPAHILVAAEKPAGAYYGVLNLLERDTAESGTLNIPAGTVADWPEMGWRGLHLSVDSRADLPDLEKILTVTMPRYRLNRLILETDYHFRFVSHPEVIEGDALTVADCRRLKQLADEHFVTLTPMINCLGHQSWAQSTAQLLKAHPEFDETPDVPADNKGIYCRSWCPSNPAVNKVVFDLMDELIDAFDAKSFHVGMDEVFLIGKCPRCKDTSPAKLFAKAVTDLHTHLVGKRHVEMMMWGDRLLDGKTTGYGEWEASENGTFPAIDLIPKDIVMCDWHYELTYNDKPAEYPSVHLFQDKGLRVWPSSWKSAENAQKLAHASLQNRTPRMVGYLATTWISVRQLTAGLAKAESAKDDKEANGVASALRAGARIAWEGESI